MDDNKSEDVLVHTYLNDRKAYLVSNVVEQSSTTEAVTSEKEEEDPLSPATNLMRSNASSTLRNSLSVSPVASNSDVTLKEVSWTLLESSPSAKFYPVLESLMRRGDETAAAARQFWKTNQATQTVVKKTGKAIMQKANESSANDSSTTTTLDDVTAPTVQNAKGRLNQLADQAEQAAPVVEEQFRQILTMVKDEEITSLLENAKSRLEELVTTDLSAATREALERQGIRINLDLENDSEEEEEEKETQDEAADEMSREGGISISLKKSRQAALKSIQRILQQADLDTSDLKAVRGELTENFTTAFDHLATAARSDRNLHQLFDTIAEKTTVWQEASGRLLQTRSASLFLEGATRLQARAAAIFLVHQRTGSEIGSKMTKAFTEGDAAIARIKSIQLGDALKDRLVRAIEVRSDSMGGLDAIIAGALSSVRRQDDGDQIQNMLSTLQTNASSATTDARETLITVLSRHNTYRDVALSKLESVLCDLETQFGSDFSPDDIAALVRGEGGTAKLFEPIARRAWQQIEKQLDEAESQVSDTTVLQGLSRVRKIMSGELTLSALTDEIVSVLNDENIVAAGEVFVQKGEEVLDALEGVSSNQAVNDALKIAEKAGITKDSVMREIQKLDVDQLLDTAGGAVTDETKRRQLVSSAIDTALDFILRILPSMPVPPFEGVRDGLLYNISNLSMAGFKVKKEDIMIELAGMRALKRSNTPAPDGDRPQEDEKSSKMENGVGSENERAVTEVVGATDTMEIEEITQEVNAAELLIIDVRRISAVLDDTEWSFEQTYMPYLKAQGKSDVRLSDGAIRLQFELRRRRKVVEGDSSEIDENTVGWEPVLCLHDRSCSIDEVELKMQGEGRLAWLVNKAASIFKNRKYHVDCPWIRGICSADTNPTSAALRDYVVRTIVKLLTNKSGWLLEKLNGVLAPYWDLILKTAKLNLEDLVEADERVVVKEMEKSDPTLFELVWRKRLPLGMNLLMNDGSGQLKVVDFPRGSQARLVAEKRGLDPDMFKGATVVAVNGTFFDEQDDLFDALKDPARPKSVKFRLAENADAERIRQFVEGDKVNEDEEEAPTERQFELRSFTANGDIGIEFKPSPDKCGLIVSGFIEGEGGIILDAERSGQVKVGDLLTHVNGSKVVSTNGEGQSKALDVLAKYSGKKPLDLTFTEPYLHEELIKRPKNEKGDNAYGGPDELVLEEKKESAGARRIFVKRFRSMCGMAEGGGILIGDHIAFINGMPFGAGKRWLGEPRNQSLDELHEVLYNKDFYPMGITFARPKTAATARWTSGGAGDFDDLDADTICITVETPDRLGCIFEMHANGDIVVKDFIAVPGVFNRSLTKLADEKGRLHVAIDSVNGQFVPSYATEQMLRNALKRSWNSDQREVQLWLCDDDKRNWIRALE